MNKTITIIIFTTLILLKLSSILGAQEVNLSANVDRSTISLNEQLTLSVTVKGNINNVPEPNIPPLSDFSIISRFQSQNVEIINFQTSASITYQYILQPRRAGTFTINPITINHQGTIYKTQPIPVEVTKSAGSPPVSYNTPARPGIHPIQPQQPSFPGMPSMTAPPSIPTNIPNFPFMNEDISSSIFAHASLDKKTAYINEQIVLTVSFCYPADQAVERRLFPPNNTGFLIEEVPGGPGKYFATIKDRRFAIEEFKYVLYPISPGTLKIESISINYQVQDFFGASGDIIKTEPIEIEVAPLPGQAPSNFTNSVGSFSINSYVEPSKTPMDEPITLFVTISGEGNISTLELPKLNELYNFKKFDTTDSYKLNPAGSKITGEKTFKTTLIPQKTGELTIAPVTFSYFDPERKEYTSISTNPLKVEVTSATNKSIAASASKAPGIAEDTQKKEDIRYIKSGGKLFGNTEKPLYKNLYFIIVMMIPIIVIMLMTIQTIRTEKIEKDKGKIKKSQALKNFRNNLSHTGRYLKKKQWGDFHATLYRGILEYLGDKCQIQSSGLTIQQIKEILEEKAIPKEKIDELADILSTCDFARFASSDNNESDCRQNIDKCIKIINMLDKKLS